MGVSSSWSGMVLPRSGSISVMTLIAKVLGDIVAPGSIWALLIPATVREEKVEGFGTQTPLGGSVRLLNSPGVMFCLHLSKVAT